jgi:hypothetical protein
MMAREYYCPVCRRKHRVEGYRDDSDAMPPARVIWESIAFLFIVLAIIYGGSAISFWLATRPQ